MTESIDPTTTTPTEGASIVLGNDGTVLDPVRQQALITKLREQEKVTRAELVRFKGAFRELAAGRPIPEHLVAELGADDAQGELGSYRAAFQDVASNLGVKPTATPSEILRAVKAARLSGPLADAIHAAGADPTLTRAVIGDLADVDLASESLHDDLVYRVETLMEQHPNLKVRRGMDSAVTSGAPFNAGSGQGAGPLLLTREELAFIPADELVRLKKAGALGHLGVGR
jgi:hypothetical protein